MKQYVSCLQFSSKGRRCDKEEEAFDCCVEPVRLISVQTVHFRLLEHKSFDAPTGFSTYKDFLI